MAVNIPAPAAPPAGITRRSRTPLPSRYLPARLPACFFHVGTPLSKTGGAAVRLKVYIEALLSIVRSGGAAAGVRRARLKLNARGRHRHSRVVGGQPELAFCLILML